MFDQKDMDAYREIHAPRELKERICNREYEKTVSSFGMVRKSYKILQPVAAVAACLMLLLIGYLVLDSSVALPDFYLEGQRITTQEKPIKLEPQNEDTQKRLVARTATNQIKGRLQVGKKVTVRIPEEVKEQEEMKVEKISETVYLWTIEEANYLQEYKLVLEEKNKEYGLILKYDQTIEQWLMHIEK